MAQFHDTPAVYLELVRADLPLYDTLQDELVRATEGLAVTRLLDLGVGTGETSRRCLVMHPGATVVAVDKSPQMLELAAVTLGPGAELSLARLEDALPPGPFDLVISALAVHHLDGHSKADLFSKVHRCLGPGGVFVMADVVVPESPVEQPTHLDPEVDRPDRLVDLLAWLRNAGLQPELRWSAQDLVVISASRT